MISDLRRHDWRRVFGQSPVGVLEYIRDELNIDVDYVGEIASLEEIPAPIRRAIISCAVAERNAGKPLRLETVADIAVDHGAPVNPVAMALGWMPPSHMELNELERTTLRLVAEMDLANRSVS